LHRPYSNITMPNHVNMHRVILFQLVERLLREQFPFLQEEYKSSYEIRIKKYLHILATMKQFAYNYKHPLNAPEDLFITYYRQYIYGPITESFKTAYYFKSDRSALFRTLIAFLDECTKEWGMIYDVTHIDGLWCIRPRI